MKDSNWWGKLPVSTRFVLFGVLGFILFFIILGTWKAVFGLFLSVFGLLNSHDGNVSKERDKADDLKVKIDEEWQRKAEEIRETLSAREAAEKKKQSQEDKKIETYAETKNEKERVNDLMEGVDEILGKK